MNFLAFLRFIWLPFSKRQKQPHVNRGQKHKRTGLQLEAFEDRLVPSGSPVAAAFFPDVNSDGSTAQTVNTGWLSGTPTAVSGPFNSTLPGTIPQFNSALGTLTSVDVEEVVGFQTTGSLQNTNATLANSINVEADLTAALTSPAVSDLDVSKFFSQQSTFNATPAGTSGDTAPLNLTNNNLTATQTLTSAADLAAFSGQGALPIIENLTGLTKLSGLPQMNNNVQSTGSVQIEVRYHYLPADVAIVKTVTPSSTLPGAPITYTLTATNNGPGAASNVVVSDPLPAGETLVSATSSDTADWQEVSTTNGVTFTDASLASGAIVTFTIVADAPSNAGQYTNTATINSSTTDTNLNNNQSSATVTVTQPQADLSILKSASPTTVQPGGPVTYTLTVTNNSTTTAANTVVVNDTLPTGETLVSATPSSNAWTTQSTTGAVTFQDASLAAGASATFTITVTAPTTAGPYSNTATVSSLTPDSNPSNNQATATITVTPVAQADLGITKVASPTTVLPGGQVTYTMTVTNNSTTTAASNVVMNDTLPLGETLLSATSSSTDWIPQSTTGGVTFIDPTLAAGASATFTVVASAPNTAGPYSNTATVSSLTPDSNPSNNQATATITVTPVAQVDLSITKSANPTTVQPGGPVTYTLTVTNNSTTTAASNVVMNDTLPTGETLVSAIPSSTDWIAQSTTGGVTFTDGSLAAGASATFIITVTAPSNAGPYSNTATVSSLTPDSNLSNNQATATITVTPVAQADLSITKSANPTTVQPGGPVTYTLIVTNNSTTTAANTVVVNDTLPTGETLVSATASSNAWAPQSTTGGVTFTDGSLAAGASATFIITVTAPSNAGPYSNTATVSSLTPDSNLSNNQATATITVTPVAQADLSITKSANPTTVQPGGPVTYTLTVTNNSTTTAASNVVMNDTLPTGETLVSATASSNAWAPQSTTGGVTFTDGSLAAGASATFIITVTAPSNAGPYSNTATVSSLTPDSNLSNNQATATITVTPVAQADLSITKSANPTTVQPGGPVTYTLTVTNNSTTTASSNVVVNDTLPSGETLVSATASSNAWTAQSTTGGVTFADGSLAAGASATFTIVVAAPSSAGQYSNTATVSALTPDPNLNNNTATATITVPAADLSILKTVTPSSVSPGGTVTYTLTVTNNSTTTAASNVVVNDSLPGGETLVSATPSSTDWTTLNSTGDVMFLDSSLAAGASATFTIVVTAPSSAGQYTNMATVSALTPDPNLSNNTATATITVAPPPQADLSIVKTVDPATVLAGGTVTYTLTVTNNSTTTAASNVSVNDPLPTGEVFQSATEPTGWAMVNTAGTLSFTDPSLAAGAIATFTITVTAPTTPGDYDNTAIVTSLTPDPNPNNNISTIGITVNSIIDPGPPPILPPPITPPVTPPPPTTPPPTTPTTTPTPPSDPFTKATLLGSSSWWLRMMGG